MGLRVTEPLEQEQCQQQQPKHESQQHNQKRNYHQNTQHQRQQRREHQRNKSQNAWSCKQKHDQQQQTTLQRQQHQQQHAKKSTKPPTPCRVALQLSYAAATLTTAKHTANLPKRFPPLSWATFLLLSLVCVAPTPAHASTAALMTATLVRSTITHFAAAAVMTATSSGAAATTYEPPLLKFQIEVESAEQEKTAQEEGSTAEVNSNEEQLLEYYKQAQQHHHYRHRQRDAPLPPLATAVDFDDIVPTAGVVSTLSNSETHVKKGATKRSAPALQTTPAASPSSSPSSTTELGTTTATEEKCEPKVLEDIPPEPFYDFTDIAEDAARQFTEFLASKVPASSTTNQPVITEQLREEVRQRANGIATYALNEDESLLAFAIAAPSIHTVVVKFRDNVTIPPQEIHNKQFLGSYWRELGYAWNSTNASQQWGAPFKDCNLLKGRWLWPFRISFSEYKIKVVAAAFIAADEDSCNDDLEEIFGRRHACDRNTTFCLVTGEKPTSTRDHYTCICKESFYLPNSTLQGFSGEAVELSDGYDNYSCIPCPGGCTACDQHGVCLFGEPQEAVSMENLLKITVGTVLGACILCCIVLSVIVFQQRKCKAIASGMWTVLETILLGIVLLYASVAVHFFPASTERCMVEPWLRELGFITCYGAIILKLYRHLVDFRTRKAHRWVLRDVDLLKYLGTMVFAVICYMAAFTASSLDLLQTAHLESLRELSTNTCLPLKWEFVTQASEVLILCFGLHLAYASRNANTQFRERQFLVATLLIEFLASTTLYVLRYIYLPEMSPGYIFLALFLRSQLTNTVSLGLIFVPKLWYQHKQRTIRRPI